MMNLTVDELKREANGKWEGILSQLGVDVNASGKHGTCPICQDGVDRFRWDNKNGDGTFFCNQCQKQSGDGLALVMGALSMSFPEAMQAVEKIVGTVVLEPQPKKPDYDVKKLLNTIWGTSLKLTGSDFVSKYLHARGLLLQPDNVRSCVNCYESDTKERIPAMVALVTCVDGTAGALHRTYLSGELKSPKKLTPTTKPLSGGAVRLFPLQYKTLKGDTVGIAEGIETAIATTQLFDIPTWAAIGTSMLESFTPPQGVKKLVIFGDNDANFAGQKAAYTLANKWILKDMVVNVEIPESVGDFNDIITQAILT